MYHRLYLHVVWTTLCREPLIDAVTARLLADQIPLSGRADRALVLELGIVSTHLHLLAKFHPTTRIPELLQRFKGTSAHVANRSRAPSHRPLKWAKGYSVSSVGERSLDLVAAYVRNQHLHHPLDAIAGWPPPRPALSSAPGSGDYRK
ncbi:MAG TPA: IS200/IS605 family transposase [Gemmatimonadales bacterium]